MTEHLTQADVEEIAKYTRIGVDAGELATLTNELNSIIDELQPIKDFDLEGVEPTFHPIGGIVNIVRDDEEKESFSQEEALANAPRAKDGAFLIPSILGEGGGV